MIDLSTVGLIKEPGKKPGAHGLTNKQRLWLVKEVIGCCHSTPQGWYCGSRIILRIPYTCCEFRIKAGAPLSVEPKGVGWCGRMTEYKYVVGIPRAQAFIERLYTGKKSRDNAVKTAIEYLERAR